MTNRKTALVTGAAQGIGRGIAQVLNADGYRVAVVDLNLPLAEECAAQLGNGAFAVKCDVTTGKDVTEAVRTVLNTAGSIEVLVNVAGGDRVMPFIESDEADWVRETELNLFSVYRFVKAVLPAMTEQGYGRIINVASETGRIGSANQAAYSGAKAGVIGFSKAVAREVGNTGVTINCVSPGAINTPALQKLIEAQGPEGRAHVEAALASSPIGRVGEPDEVGAAVVFLSSPVAGYITGQTLSVSGGLSMI